jgi:hypothetical protein
VLETCRELKNKINKYIEKTVRQVGHLPETSTHITKTPTRITKTPTHATTVDMHF